MCENLRSLVFKEKMILSLIYPLGKVVTRASELLKKCSKSYAGSITGEKRSDEVKYYKEFYDLTIMSFLLIQFHNT